MELRESLFFVLGQSLIGGGYGWTVGGGFSEGRQEFCYDVVDCRTDVQAMEGDDIAGDEGVIWVVDQVVDWFLEVL